MRGLARVAKFFCAVLLVCCLPMLLSCQTTPTEETGPPLPEKFEPATFVSRLHLGGGEYEDLLGPSSYAVWVGQEVVDLKRDADFETGVDADVQLDSAAAQIGANYLVVECHLESVFADASIAYDVVGLRNIDVYLQNLDGSRTYPIQQIMGGHADETQQAALKRFTRTNIVVFPMRDVILDRPTIPRDAEGVRLVVDGFHSQFYFEWEAKPLEGAEDWAPTEVESEQASRIGFAELYSKLKAITRYLQ